MDQSKPPGLSLLSDTQATDCALQSSLSSTSNTSSNVKPTRHLQHKKSPAAYVYGTSPATQNKQRRQQASVSVSSLAESKEAMDPLAKSSRSSFGSFNGGSGSLFLEKTRLGPRRATPDSEALASSDDEGERQTNDPSSHPTSHKPARRASWLSEVQPLQPRKGSITGVGPLAPSTSLHTPTSADSSGWGPNGSSGSGRTPTTQGGFAWGSGIWNNDTRKEPPARLTEVLPSPTTVIPPGSSPLYGEGDMLASPITREHAGDSTIPFAIPLHPTPKTYRSQSYSVGQTDPETPNALPGNGPSTYFHGRMRSAHSSSLQHRPSRPSMLSELSHEGTPLDRVREVDDDDDDSATGSQHGVRVGGTEAQTVEQLARENALLRQAAAANQLENMRLRNRAASTNTVNSAAYPGGHVSPRTAHGLRETVPEESDYAVDELDDVNDLQGFGSKPPVARRYSEYGLGPEDEASSFVHPENRKLESLKKGHWQSSLGFGGLAEGSQSRRHSFADVPARHSSMSSGSDHKYSYESTGADGSIGGGGKNDAVGSYLEQAVRQSPGDRTASYFKSDSSPMIGAYHSTAGPHSNIPDTYSVPASYANFPLTAPTNMANIANNGARSMISTPHQLGHHPAQPQSLYIVTFKCCRAEVFYIQEGTGLQVKPGDLVIVEADRGTDLGTVLHEKVSWDEAKRLKEHFTEEHYRWLMMFSRHQATNGNALDTGGALTSNGNHGSAVGGMGPQGGPQQQGMQEPNTGELKPKMIRRLAQHHEIQTLREKEGNEAKAKRVCQQKVVEHRLHMEILDAEFQVDWKKLTFYYFADAYINFNSLVTDLFKIYKTRIWMSAINPASFASPSAGPQPPGAVGPGPLAYSGYGPSDPRQQQDPQFYGDTGPQRSFQPGFAQPNHSLQETGLRSMIPQEHKVYMGMQPQAVPSPFQISQFGGFRPGQPGAAAGFRGNGSPAGHLANTEGFINNLSGLSLGP